MFRWVKVMLGLAISISCFMRCAGGKTDVINNESIFVYDGKRYKQSLACNKLELSEMLTLLKPALTALGLGGKTITSIEQIFPHFYCQLFAIFLIEAGMRVKNAQKPDSFKQEEHEDKVLFLQFVLKGANLLYKMLQTNSTDAIALLEKFIDPSVSDSIEWTLQRLIKQLDEVLVESTKDDKGGLKTEVAFPTGNQDSLNKYIGQVLPLIVDDSEWQTLISRARKILLLYNAERLRRKGAELARRTISRGTSIVRSVFTSSAPDSVPDRDTQHSQEIDELLSNIIKVCSDILSSEIALTANQKTKAILEALKNVKDDSNVAQLWRIYRLFGAINIYLACIANEDDLTFKAFIREFESVKKFDCTGILQKFENVQAFREFRHDKRQVYIDKIMNGLHWSLYEDSEGKSRMKSIPHKDLSDAQKLTLSLNSLNKEFIGELGSVFKLLLFLLYDTEEGAHFPVSRSDSSKSESLPESPEPAEGSAVADGAQGAVQDLVQGGVDEFTKTVGTDEGTTAPDTSSSDETDKPKIGKKKKTWGQIGAELLSSLATAAKKCTPYGTPPADPTDK